MTVENTKSARDIRNVAATMAIENMPDNKYCYPNSEVLINKL